MVFGFDSFQVRIDSESAARDAIVALGFGDVDCGCDEMDRLIRMIEGLDDLAKREELMTEWAYELSAYEIYCSVGRCARYGG